MYKGWRVIVLSGLGIIYIYWVRMSCQSGILIKIRLIPVANPIARHPYTNRGMSSIGHGYQVSALSSQLWDLAPLISILARNEVSCSERNSSEIPDRFRAKKLPLVWALRLRYPVSQLRLSRHLCHPPPSSDCESAKQKIVSRWCLHFGVEIKDFSSRSEEHTSELQSPA